MSTTQNNPFEPLEFWMELKDRELLLELMETQKVSARELAKFAGWKSHSYMNRLLKPVSMGGVDTLKTDPAIRIAYRLGTPVHRLFRTRSSAESAQNVRGMSA